MSSKTINNAHHKFNQVLESQWLIIDSALNRFKFETFKSDEFKKSKIS